jgi:hypothetical protein
MAFSRRSRSGGKSKRGGRKSKGGGRSARCSARGWGKKSPRTRRERKRVYDKCGRKCFLGKDLSFPVCSKYTRKCKRDRAGVCAARYRADQHDHKEIARKARRILDGGESMMNYAKIGDGIGNAGVVRED